MTPFSTLLGELQLGQGLRRCYTPIYSAIIPQIETLVKLKRAVFSLCYFKRRLTDELRTEQTGSCAPSSTRIPRFPELTARTGSTSSRQTTAWQGTQCAG